MPGLPIDSDALRHYTPKAAAGDGWNPTSIQAHEGASTFERNRTFSNTSALTSGTLQLCGGAIMRPKQLVSSVSFVSASTAAVAPTAQWFCIVRQRDLAVLAKTADDTNVAWPTFTLKTLAIATPITVEEWTPVYLGIVVVAGTPINLHGNIPSGASPAIATPKLCGASTAGLTTPGTLGATADAITANQILGWASFA